MLGLGLGLNKSNYIRSIIGELKSAGAVLALLSSKANGSAPLTGNSSPWVDLINANNGTLTNFAGTELSGWDKITVAQGKNYFDKDNAIPGSRCDLSTGAFVSDPNAWRSDYMLIEELNQYTRSGYNGINNVVFSYFDSSKNYLGRSSINTGATRTETSIASARFVVISQYGFVDNANMLAEFSLIQDGTRQTQLEKGATPTAYEPFTGKDESFLTFDGVDDFVSFADVPELDITTAPLAIGVTFKKSPSDNGFLLAKNNIGLSDVQYGILLDGVRDVYFYNQGSALAFFQQTIVDYTNIVYYWDGINIKGYENSDPTPKSTQAFVGPLSSAGLLQVGRRKASNYLEGNIATVTIYTGSDIQKILDVEAKIAAPYLALNP